MKHFAHGKAVKPYAFIKVFDSLRHLVALWRFGRRKAAAVTANVVPNF